MWPNPQFPVDLVTFTEQILNGNFIFCAVTLAMERCLGTSIMEL